MKGKKLFVCVLSSALLLASFSPALAEESKESSNGSQPAGFSELKNSLTPISGGLVENGLTVAEPERHVQATADGMSVHRAVIGSYTRVYFTADPATGAIRTVMLSGLSEPVEVNRTALMEYYYSIEGATRWALGQDEAVSEDISGLSSEEIYTKVGFDLSCATITQFQEKPAATVGSTLYGFDIDGFSYDYIVATAPEKLGEDMTAFRSFSQPIPTLPARDITIIVNGETLSLDAQARTANGRVMVPIRGIFEKLGAVVGWKEEFGAVTITKGDDEMELLVDQGYAYLNGEIKLLDAPASLQSGRTLAPLRFVSEALNATVLWDEATYTVTVATP